MRPSHAAWSCALTVLVIGRPAEGSPRLVVLDDGEKVARDQDRELPESPWNGDVELFAMRGETIAVQAVIEADRRVEGIHATLGAFVSENGTRIEPVVEVLSEYFLNIASPSGNDREPGSLAFTAASAPAPNAFSGFFADPLVPLDSDADPGKRAALWVDITVTPGTPAGIYRTALNVSDARGAIGARAVSLRVIDRDLPYAAAKTMVYYEPDNLIKRMGDTAAERDLRHVLHAHHLSGIHDLHVKSPLELDDEALSGDLFTPARGYAGPGEGVGEGVFAIGAYGSLGAPSLPHLAVAEQFAEHLRPYKADVFLYAIDETCESPWGGQWLDLFRRSEKMAGIRVGVTCGKDPLDQRSDLIMMTSADYVPARARIAKAAGKWVWAYNGQRPYAGPLMLDVPATDLRANAWIAARYGIDRWFYWESTYWLDNNRGGRGGWEGFDPYETAETFHNGDGDHCNGDGILLYPGTQIGRDMRDFGLAQLFPSVRLKNLRRGIEDAGYIALARKIDPEAADAIVHRTIPRALAIAGSRVAWPERGADWLEARRALAAIIERGRRNEPPAANEKAHLGCSVGTAKFAECQGDCRARWGAGIFLLLLLPLRRVRRQKDRLD